MSNIIQYDIYRARDLDTRIELYSCFNFFIEMNNISLFDVGFAKDPIYFIETGRRKNIHKDDAPPHYDHVRLCKIKNGERFVIYCPYAPEKELDSDREWAKERGLHFTVYDKSASLYGCGTTMIVLSERDLEFQILTQLLEVN